MAWMTDETLNFQVDLTAGPACSSYTNQSDCEAAGCYWYDDSCHSTPQPTCQCTGWVDAECVSNTQRKQTRTCNPSGCDVEERIIDDPSCKVAPPAKKKFPWWILLIIGGGIGTGILIAKTRKKK